MKLWHEFTIAEQRRYDHIFQSIVNPITLNAEEFVLLVQWLFVSQRYTIQTITKHNNGYDIVITSAEGRELVRASQGNPPFNVIDELMQAARDEDYKKLRIYTFGSFTAAQHKTQNQFPLFLELVDRDKLISRIEEVRRMQSLHDHPKSKPVAKESGYNDIEPYYTASQPKQHYGISSKKTPNLSNPRRPAFAKATIIILSSLMIIVVAVLSYIFYLDKIQSVIYTVLTQANQPPIIEQTNNAVSTFNAQVSQTNQAVSTLNTTVTAIKRTNDAASTQNSIVSTRNAALNFTPTRAITPSRTATPTRTATKAK